MLNNIMDLVVWILPIIILLLYFNLNRIGPKIESMINSRRVPVRYSCRLLLSILTAVVIFVFVGSSWIDSPMLFVIALLFSIDGGLGISEVGVDTGLTVHSVLNLALRRCVIVLTAISIVLAELLILLSVFASTDMWILANPLFAGVGALCLCYASFLSVLIGMLLRMFREGAYSRLTQFSAGVLWIGLILLKSLFDRPPPEVVFSPNTYKLIFYFEAIPFFVGSLVLITYLLCAFPARSGRRINT